MRNLSLLAAVLLVSPWLPMARAADVLRDISWAELKESGVPLAGTVTPAESPRQGDVLKIENPEDQPKQIMLLELKNPGVTRAAYAIRGQVRCENVKGKSCLEMWNYFPDGGAYFSRTLSETGLMKHLEGTSGWRDFSLPFVITKGNTRPNRLVLNMVFEGRGTVYLGPLRLEQYDSARQALRIPGAWWDDQTGGLLGGIMGSVLGCLGGLIGILAGRGRARVVVMELTAAIMFLGMGLLAVGLTALVVGQPYAVWFPTTLGGVISTGVFGGLRPTIRRRYEQQELEQMSAVDLGGRPA